MKKKILFVITKSNWGGAQRYVFDMATGLAQNYDVSVALGGEGRLADMLRGQNISVIQIPHLQRDISIKEEWRAARELFKIFRSVRPDIVHLNSSKAAGIGTLVARIARVPHIVFTAHAWAWNEDRPLHARIAIGLLHWLTVRFAHRTITVSHAVYDQMARLPFTKRRMRVVHLGIAPLPRISRAEARARMLEILPTLKAKKDAVWITSIGELHPIKGFMYAIDAVSTHMRARPADTCAYIIIGEGEERLHLEKRIQEQKLSDSVFLAGQVSDAAVLLAAFDIMLTPSLSEAFGYVVLEAGAANIPIIASNVGGIPEIIGSDGGMLVPPRDSAAIAEGLNELITKPSHGSSLTLSLHEKVMAYFTRSRMIDETKEIYDSFD